MTEPLDNKRWFQLVLGSMPFSELMLGIISETDGYRLIFSGKRTKVLAFISDLNVRPPNFVAAVEANAAEPANIVDRFVFVSLVNRSTHNPKVCKPIVGSVAINMVDKTLWPLAMSNRPCHSMSEKPPSIFETAKRSADLISAVGRFEKCFFPCIPRIPTCKNIVSVTPEKLPGVRIIAEQVAALIKRGIVFFSHDEGPFRGGQGRALLKQRFRPELFTKDRFWSQGGVQCEA